jgi:hypothetical protein
MGTPWSSARYAQYRAIHPAVETSERNRQAQKRYRARHAKRLAAARQVANILMRQSEYARDFRLKGISPVLTIIDR